MPPLNAPFRANRGQGRWRRKTFGLTADQWDALMASHNGRCAICRDEIDDRTATIDHDHHTGDIRGLLCRKCNAGLGMFRDDKALLNKALAYLVKETA